ncbi:MAG: TetR/AcrR family transcriptional regulator [Dethiosulfatibacter sp.]|nr:TetR/AcrR family transcriptional regulator [Dethiosulfatibacter sp.]
MTPKTKFSKEEIIQAAFLIAKSEGFTGITARSVAKALGCSVAPIYVNFKNIDELVVSVVKRVFDISQELISKQSGDDVMESIGKASIEFAKSYPIFFRELIMTPNPYMESYDAVEKTILDAMAEDKEMKNWTYIERRKLLLKLRIFQTGISVMIANGNMPSWIEEKRFEELLMETGEELFQIQKSKRSVMNG